MLGNSWFKKEKPLPGLVGLGGGAQSLVTIGGPGIWTASGGTKVSTPSYHYHVFTYPNSDTFKVTGNGAVTCTYIVAAGGGGGGSSSCGTNATANVGAGGGAGGLLSGTASVSAGTHPVTVGGGGAGNNVAYNRADGGPTTGYGVAGGPSEIAFPSAVTAQGGGGGENCSFRKHRGPAPWTPNPYGSGAYPSAGDAIINGGSGGGCASTPGPAYSPSSPKGPFLGGEGDKVSGTYPVTAGTPGQGNDGGVGYLDGQYGGGGGGAGGSGGHGTNSSEGGGAGGEGGNVGPVMDLSDIQPSFPSPWADAVGLPGSYAQTRLCGGGAGSGVSGSAPNWYGGGRSTPTGLEPTVATAGAGRGWVTSGPGGTVPAPTGAAGGDGIASTGGGGGGGAQTWPGSPNPGTQTLGGDPVAGGAGGSGLVVIRYPV